MQLYISVRARCHEKKGMDCFSDACEEFPELPAVCAVCDKAATSQCSGCRAVMYCCEAHQREDWKAVHRELCTRGDTSSTDAAIGDSIEQKESTFRRVIKAIAEFVSKLGSLALDQLYQTPPDAIVRLVGAIRRVLDVQNDSVMAATAEFFRAIGAFVTEMSRFLGKAIADLGAYIASNAQYYANNISVMTSRLYNQLARIVIRRITDAFRAFLAFVSGAVVSATDACARIMTATFENAAGLAYSADQTRRSIIRIVAGTVMFVMEIPSIAKSVVEHGAVSAGAKIYADRIASIMNDFAKIAEGAVVFAFGRKSVASALATLKAIVNSPGVGWFLTTLAKVKSMYTWVSAVVRLFTQKVSETIMQGVQVVLPYVSNRLVALMDAGDNVALKAIVLVIGNAIVLALETMVVQEMEQAMELKVPLKVDVGIGENWLLAKS